LGVDIVMKTSCDGRDCPDIGAMPLTLMTYVMPRERGIRSERAVPADMENDVDSPRTPYLTVKLVEASFWRGDDQVTSTLEAEGVTLFTATLPGVHEPVAIKTRETSVPNPQLWGARRPE
jgi:hypothetical protein